MSEAVVLVGTKKGLWVGRSDDERQDWEWSDPQFLMEAIYGTCVDTREADPRLFVTARANTGAPASITQTTADVPGLRLKAAVRFLEVSRSSAERVWQIQPGGPNDPDVIYAGTEPHCSAPQIAVNRSASSGRWDHPHREGSRAAEDRRSIRCCLIRPIRPM